MGLTWTPKAEATIKAATSARSPAPAKAAPFAWSLRGGLSRTAFRPMDSAHAVKTAAGRLDAESISGVRAITDHVASRFGYPTGAFTQ